jgi:hypothetical protein
VGGAAAERGRSRLLVSAQVPHEQRTGGSGRVRSAFRLDRLKREELTDFIRGKVDRNLTGDRARIVGEHEILHRLMAIPVPAGEQQPQRGKIVPEILFLDTAQRERLKARSG